MPDSTDSIKTVSAQKDQHASVPGGADETTPQGSGTPQFGPPASPDEIGMLGRYRVVKQLGKGGMGAVYMAVDVRLDRKLALKVMLPEFAADGAAKERFLREARAAAKITHDNVVTVYEADERDGVPYIAMQLLQGYPLDEYLKMQGPPALAHVIRIARETALGLAAAHELGLVHRDVKPANLWLEAPNGRAKILDFGLAKPIGTDAELTRSGAVVGTPAYMSPEQARGLKVDHRTDLFSLGAVLYRLCTGTQPFAGPNVLAVLMALGSDDPTPVRELNPNIPEALAQLIHQLLAKKPENRPQTGSHVADCLREILDQILVPQPPKPVSGAEVPVTPAANLSGSQPVVVHPLPAQPPLVGAMEVPGAPGGVFTSLDGVVERLAAEQRAREDAERRRQADDRVRAEQDAAERARQKAAEAAKLARGERPQWLVAPFDHNRARAGQRHWATYLDVPVVETFTVGEAESAGGWALFRRRAKPVQMTFVFVPPGTFQMGSDRGEENEKPVHQVTLTRGFYVAATPVTQAQWRAVMGQDSPHCTFEGPDLPVDGVPWNGCQAFCQRLTEVVSGRGEFRLPTEAEWEYACRAGTTTDYHSGDGAAALAKVGWYKANSGKTTHPVGQLAPNAWGLHDMHGNVWEWVLDWEGPYPAQHAEDPTGPARGLFRVLRGGSWAFGAGNCRSADRNWFEESRGGAPTPSDLRGDPPEPNDDIGFRPVLAVLPD